MNRTKKKFTKKLELGSIEIRQITNIQPIVKCLKLEIIIFFLLFFLTPQKYRWIIKPKNRSRERKRGEPTYVNAQKN